MQLRTEFYGNTALLPEMPAVGHSRQSTALAGQLPQHFHEKTFEIVFITRGSVEWHIDKVLFRLSAGDLFLTRPNEPHGAVNEALEASEIYWIQFRLSGSAPFGLSRDETENILHRLETARRTARFMPGMTRHFDRILFGSAGKALIRAHALTLIDCAIDNLQPAENAQGGKRRIEAAQSWARERLSEKLRVADWALQAGLSATRFYELFKHEAGLAPMDWLNRERIRTSCDMLRDPNRSITEIAFATGFSSTQYFSTSFRKFVGHAPSAYRRFEPRQIAPRSFAR